METLEDKSKENVTGDTDSWGNLVFQIGEESRPKIETLEEIGKSFFTDTYRNAFSLIEDIVKQSDDIRGNESKDRDKYERLNNIIAFIGERGAGKTSCMLTVHSILRTLPFADRRDNCIIQGLGNDGQNVSEKNVHMLGKSYLTMDLIDPSFFRDDNNILEIIVANMFKKFKSHAEDPKGRLDCEDDNHVEKKRVLIRSFQKVKDALDGMNYSRHTNDSIDGLNQMASTMELKQDIQALIGNYADYFRNPQGVLVIAVDDIDLQTTHAYRMIEQIRKYLILPNVVILMAVKLSQLTDIIRQHYYDEYKTLISKDALSDSVENMTERYLTKLIPYEHRLYLPDLEINLSKQLTIKVEEKNIRGKIKDMVLTLIYKKTGYLFYNSSQQASLIIPRNLRDLLNLIAMLYHMDDLSEVNRSHLSSIKSYNRHLFKKYFFETWCRENLESDMHTYLCELATQDLAMINKLMLSYLASYYQKKGLSFDLEVIDRASRVYNISFADIWYMLHEIEIQFPSFGIQKYVFAVKTLYSMLFLEAYEEMLQNQSEISDIFFDNLIDRYYINVEENKNARILKQYKKLDRYSNYEKLLGGDILYGEYKNFLIGEFAIYPKIIKTNILNDLFEQLTQVLIEPERLIFLSYGNTNFTLTREHALNLWEFFILNISHGVEIFKYYRSGKQCYYDYLPFKLGTQALFDNTAILFNIIKYYNYYQHAQSFKDDGDNSNQYGKYNKTLWLDFSKLINHEKSLFRGIYTSKPVKVGEMSQNKKSEEENKVIKIIPPCVYNVEMLDLLSESLSVFSKEDSKDANWNNMHRFYRRLYTSRMITGYSDMEAIPKIEPIFSQLECITTFMNSINPLDPSKKDPSKEDPSKEEALKVSRKDTLRLFNIIYNSVKE